MREIKFRARLRDLANEQFPKLHAKRKMEFVYGTGVYIDTHNTWLILENPEKNTFDQISATLVDPETVGQYTGLKDRKGKEIYEGDIDSEFDEGYRYVVFKDGAYGLQYHDDEKSFDPFILWDQVEVIGNIYEHPHLLGGSE